MEQLLFSFITWNTIVYAIITTFFVSALNTVQNKVSTNWLVFLVSLFVTLLSITFSGSGLQYWQSVMLQIMVTMSFSIMFYNYVGKWFIDRFFQFLKEKLQASNE